MCSLNPQPSALYRNEADMTHRVPKCMVLIIEATSVNPRRVYTSQEAVTREELDGGTLVKAEE